MTDNKRGPDPHDVTVNRSIAEMLVAAAATRQPRLLLSALGMSVLGCPELIVGYVADVGGTRLRGLDARVTRVATGALTLERADVDLWTYQVDAERLAERRAIAERILPNNRKYPDGDLHTIGRTLTAAAIEDWPTVRALWSLDGVDVADCLLGLAVVVAAIPYCPVVVDPATHRHEARP